MLTRLGEDSVWMRMLPKVTASILLRVMPVFFSIDFRRKLKKDRYLITRFTQPVIGSQRVYLKYAFVVDTQSSRSVASEKLPNLFLFSVKETITSKPEYQLC